MKISLPNLLTIIFVVLKLTGNISWSWIWVLSPTWILMLIGFALLALIGFAEVLKK